jgi:hypothetical protein
MRPTEKALEKELDFGTYHHSYGSHQTVDRSLSRERSSCHMSKVIHSRVELTLGSEPELFNGGSTAPFEFFDQLALDVS